MKPEINPYPQRAADLVGGQSNLARLLSTPNATITPQGVGAWCRHGKMPAERVQAVLALLGVQGNVTAHQLRPDVFAAPRKRAVTTQPAAPAPAG